MSKYYDTVSVLKHKRVAIALGKHQFRFKFSPFSARLYSAPRLPFSPLTTQQITQSGRLFKTDHKSNKRETRDNMDTWTVEEDTAVVPAVEEQQVQVFVLSFFRQETFIIIILWYYKIFLGLNFEIFEILILRNLTLQSRNPSMLPNSAFRSSSSLDVRFNTFLAI